MSKAQGKFKKITTHRLLEMKANGEKISMLTAYDFSMAKILDKAGIDILLVGDSASNVMAGNDTTLPITLDHMIWHATSVVKAVSRAFVVVDVPFGSYQGNSNEALRSSIRIMKESGAHRLEDKPARNRQRRRVRVDVFPPAFIGIADAELAIVVQPPTVCFTGDSDAAGVGIAGAH